MPSLPDHIHVASLELQVRIGVTAQERLAPQRLTVSLDLFPRDGFENLADRIENTVNYSAVCQAVRDLAATERERHLLETFAQEIVATILTRFRACAAVHIEVRKYILPDAEYVAVRLARTQPD